MCLVIIFWVISRDACESIITFFYKYLKFIPYLSLGKRMCSDKFWFNLGEVLENLKVIFKKILIKFIKWTSVMSLTEIIKFHLKSQFYRIPSLKWVIYLFLCVKRYFDCCKNIFLFFLSDLLYESLMLLCYFRIISYLL